MSSEAHAPSADIPSLSVRWEGLTVIIDATTLNTIVRRATRRVKEIREILVEPEGGQLGITIRAGRFFRATYRGHVDSLRYSNAFLGFRIRDLTAFGFLPVPRWALRKIAASRPGLLFFYPEDRVFVVNLTTLMPPELSLQIQEATFENGEVRVQFGPSHYRLDRLMEELDRDLFEDE